MNKEILNYIKELSLKDKKTLSQKALKLSEETGELAKEILPYENADGTLHRFTTDRRILEETSDVMLVVLSIAYDAGFTDDDIQDMMFKKANKWNEIQTKELKLKDKNRIPFEMHITVDNISDVQIFRNICKDLDVKPIMLDLHTEKGSFNDIMTSSVCIGSNLDAYLKAIDIRDKLENTGFYVKRVKIETVPWHPAAPQNKNDKMPADCYFESHLGVVTKKEDLQTIQDIAKKHNAKLSQNAFKKNADGSCIMMITYREYKLCFTDFKDNLTKLVTELKEQFEVEREIVEFSIYDTNVSHDFKWINNG